MPTSRSSSIYYLTNNYSWGLCLYIDFRMGSAPFTRGILWTSPSFRLGGVRRGNAPGNRSLYLHNRPRSAVRCYSPTLSRWGTAPSGRSFSPYSTSYKNSTGLPDVFNYASYVIFEPNVVPSGNSYLTSITLGGSWAYTRAS